MPADLEELLARAEELIVTKPIPTRSELIARLERAINQLAARFPGGPPPDGGSIRDSIARIEHMNLEIEIDGLRFALDEDGRGVNWIDDEEADDAS